MIKIFNSCIMVDSKLTLAPEFKPSTYFYNAIQKKHCVIKIIEMVIRTKCYYLVVIQMVVFLITFNILETIALIKLLYF